MPPILIVVTGDPVEQTRRERGGFDALIRASAGGEWPGEWQSVDARRGERLPSSDAISALVVTGSPHSVTERTAWMSELEGYLRVAVAGGVPVLGICFGHQLLAQALGGRVDQNPRGREMGTWRLEQLVDDELFDPELTPPEVNMSHRDSVLELPAGARLLARTEREPHAAFRAGERAWGVQFHPEFDHAVMHHYLSARRAELRLEGQDSEELASRVSGAELGSAVLKRFVRGISR